MSDSMYEAFSEFEKRVLEFDYVNKESQKNSHKQSSKDEEERKRSLTLASVISSCL